LEACNKRPISPPKPGALGGGQEDWAEQVGTATTKNRTAFMPEIAQASRINQRRKPCRRDEAF